MFIFAPCMRLRQYIQSLLLFILLAYANKTNATHVVGGEITYKRIVNDSFEITLVLYMDCLNGSIAAIRSDSISNIGIFNNAGVLIKDMNARAKAPVRINSVNYNCVKTPTSECVDKYEYKYYTQLPPIAGGYTIAYQRCCRNNFITNITNPANVGATFWTKIPDVSQRGYNSAATFKTVPPNFLCNTRNFIYDHSAIDLDGDSLAYELYTPFNGADPVNSSPRPPTGPPYTTIQWRAPFSQNKMMDGLPELRIDSITGLLTVKPRFVGQYTIGILVNEFRNGTLINTTRRDFQFNVLICAFDLISTFTENVKTCNDTVTFTNQSFGATSYLWDFGLSNITTDTSTQKEPTYVFPGAGNYNVKLKVTNGNCTDSIISTVKVFNDNVRFAGNDTTVCEGAKVKFGINDTATFKYTWFPSTFLNDSTLAKPTTSSSNSIQYIGIRKNEFCTNSDTINIAIAKVKAAFTGNINTCSDTLIIKNNTIGGVKYLWDFGVNGTLSDTSNLPEPIYLFSKVGSYKIKLLVSNGNCTDSASTTVTNYNDKERFAGRDTTLCNSAVIKLGITDTAGYTYAWSPAAFLNDSLLAQPNSNPNNTIRYIATRKNQFCTNIDTVNILFRKVVAQFTGGIKLCTDSLLIKNTSTGANQYFWDFGVTTVLDDTSSLLEPIYLFKKTGSYRIRLRVNNETCSDSTNFIFTNYNDKERFAGNDTVLCKGEILKLGINDSVGFTYNWSPAIFLNDSILAKPTATPINNISYIATRKNQFCTNTDTLNITLNKVSAQFTGGIKLCTDSLLVNNTSTGANQYLWDFGINTASNDTSNQQQPLFIYTNLGKYRIKLIARNGRCADSTFEEYTNYNDKARFAGNDTFVCVGGSVQFGISDTINYTYTWFPSLYLNDSALGRPTASPSVDTIKYIGKRKNEFCTNTDTISISLKKVTAQFGVDIKLNCRGTTIDLDSIIPFPEMKWFVNTEAIPFSDLQKKKYANGKNYTLTLIAQDGLCADTIEKQVAITANDSITLIPNVITPNGDNLNDCFYIEGIKLGGECSHLQIYNRWGQMMFDSNTDGICWDGTYNGNKATAGVYFYILNYIDKDYHGTLHVIY
jgi:gliding motility-associated-like protein